MKRHFVSCIGLMAACLIVGGSLLLPLSAQTQSPDDAAEAALTPRLKQMLNVMRIARSRHLLKPENPEMIDGAIRGLLARLDPDAELYMPADMARMGATARARSNSNSIGIDVRKLAMPPRSTGPAYRIVGTADGSPAARAGLREGDLVARIDGIPTAELLSADLGFDKRPRNRGAFEFSIVRGPSNVPIEIVLGPEARRSDAVVATPLPMGLLLLRVGQFDAEMTAGLKRWLEPTQATLDAPLRGLILDLRDISAGLIDQSIGTADLFLDTGIIVTLETRSAAAIPYPAKPGDIIAGKPIVVLINAGTAGAAEILAAALQDNKRATLIGSKSAGLGSVSSFVSLPGNRGAIRMKTGRYLSPSGRPLDKAGIKPDIEIKPAATDAAAACREVDKPADDGDGQCERRAVADDTVMQAAIAYLSAISTATKP